VKSNYSTAGHPYQRVLTSFSTGTKKKVKVTAANTETSQHQTPSSTHSGNKLYEKIRTGMQATLSVKQQPIQTQPYASAVQTKKKPSTIFTFNK
jgi:hypothetical protein